MYCRNSVKWLYRLDQNFSWDSGLPLEGDYAFKDKTGVVRLILEGGGRITVAAGYAWNGCSPKFCLFDLLLGTPEGVVDARTGRPKTYFASLVHDALYQFAGDGLPMSRRQADACFLRLMEETGFRPRYIYFGAVRLFGGVVLFLERRARRTAGKAVGLS